MESVIVPVTKECVVVDTVLGTEGAVAVVGVVAAVVGVGVSEEERVTCNYVFVHA